MNLSSYILPFSYQLTNKQIINSDVLFDILLKDNELIILEKFKKILEINVLYKPTWGIKFNKNGKKEYELYFYNYSPDNRKIDLINTIDFELASKKLNINNIKYPNNKNYVMYSYDIKDDTIENNKDDINYSNFYYVGYTNNSIDYGYSKKNNILQNKYYRYRINDIHKKHTKYFIDKFIPKDYNPELKVIFLANKLYRNYIGVYYDGITYSTLKNIINNYKIGNEFLDSYKDDGKRLSVSIDIDKSNSEIVRIGIYGILY